MHFLFPADCLCRRDLSTATLDVKTLCVRVRDDGTLLKAFNGGFESYRQQLREELLQCEERMRLLDVEAAQLTSDMKQTSQLLRAIKDHNGVRAAFEQVSDPGVL